MNVLENGRQGCCLIDLLKRAVKKRQSEDYAIITITERNNRTTESLMVPLPGLARDTAAEKVC